MVAFQYTLHTTTYTLMSLHEWSFIITQSIQPHPSPPLILPCQGLYKISTILQMTYTNVFSLMKNVLILFQISIKFVLCVPMTGTQLRISPDMGLAPSRWQAIIWNNVDQNCMMPCGITRLQWVNTLRPRHNGRHFADDIFKCIFLNENAWISLKISLKFVPRVQINNNPAMVQKMAWRQTGNKPLSEPMTTQFNDAYMRH